MKGNHADKSFQQHEYEIARDVILQILAEYQEGIDIDRLASKALESLAADNIFSNKEVKDYVQRVIFDLRNTGIVESVPNSKPIQIRPLPMGREALMDATRRGHTAIVKRLLEEPIASDTKDAALISAVIHNQTEIARLLIKAGADVNARESLFDRTPLMYVTDRTNKEIEILLRDAGAAE